MVEVKLGLTGSQMWCKGIISFILVYFKLIFLDKFYYVLAYIFSMRSFLLSGSTKYPNVNKINTLYWQNKTIKVKDYSS